MKEINNNSNEDNFADLYEKSFAGFGKLNPGQLLETQILSISKDTIFLQLNGKSEGILPREELTDKGGDLTVNVGDTIKVFFLQAKNGEMQFTTRIGGESAGPAMLEQAYQNGIPVEGVVEKEIKGGYEVKIGDSRAFCPFSQMGEKRSEDSAGYIGKHLTFKIMEYKESGRKILVSNRAIHEALRQESKEALKKTLQENMTVQGVVKSIQDFGAFVEVQGVQTLLPISEISHARVDDIKKVLTVGQEIEAVILKIDWKSERISISMKSLQADPWDKAVEKFPVDSRHTGKVARITDFGAFVTLESGLDGLVHISDLRASSKFDGGGDISVKLGQALTVKIQSIDRANKKISLRLSATKEEDDTVKKYLDTSSEGDTYNPFAALLKKK